ncbi:DUF4097 family beta strand repeat protein [bacterium]|nr:DUF4097 family beta strand repeat protein [bacterium]
MKKHRREDDVMRGVKLILVLGFLLSVAGAACADDETYTLNEVYPIKAEGTLVLYTNDAEIVIKGTDRSDLKLDVYHRISTSGLFVKSKSTPFEMIVTRENGDLFLREEGGDHSFVGFIGSMSEDYIIEIEAPKGINLKLRGDDDSYEIEGINGSISLRFEDGDARLSDCGGDEFELESDDGDIRMRGGRGEFTGYVEDGRLEVREAKFDEVLAETDDGRIYIETALSDNGNYRLNGEDGRIELDVISGGGVFTATFDDGSLRADNAFDTIEEEEGRVKLRLKGGNANVRARIEDGTIRFNAK